MNYFIDIGFIKAVKSDDVDKINEYLDGFSNSKLKYQEVDLEFIEGGKLELSFNIMLWAQFRVACVDNKINAREILLDYIIDNYKNEPQDGVGIPDIIHYLIFNCSTGDTCHKIIDSGLIAEKEYPIILEIASNLTMYNEQGVISNIFKLVSKHLNDYNGLGRSHLARAIYDGDLVRFNLLLENGASLDLPISSRSKQLPLEYAIELNESDIIESIKLEKLRLKEIEFIKNLDKDVEIHKTNSKKLKQRDVPRIRGVKK